MARDLAQRVQNNAVEQKTAPTIGGMINSMRGEMQRALPKHMDADRMARLALTVVRRTPDLAKSTPESFMGALMSAAQLGLELGVSNEAYLVPYEHKRGPLAGKIECQLIIGYQGYVKLFWQSPLAKNIDAQAVYQEDEFQYQYGLEPVLRHVPAMVRTGDPIAYYAVASLTSGGSAFVVLSPQQIKDLRGGKVGPSGQIRDPMHWMERKTAIRQLVHMLPKATSLMQAAAADGAVRTDLTMDAIDDPGALRQITMGTPVVETEAGPVDMGTGEIVEQPPQQGTPVRVLDPAADAAWLAGQEDAR